jgi:uncharacterized protein (TIGR00730 family)
VSTARIPAPPLNGRVVAVFGASAALPGELDYRTAERCGTALAGAGATVVTGGYAGLMEAVSKGAAEAGGHVIGVTVPDKFTSRSGANTYVAEEVATPSLTERIHRLVEISDASIALNGSLGTLTELIVAWNVAYVERMTNNTPKPVFAVGERWESIVTSLADDLQTDRALVTFVPNVDDAIAGLVQEFRVHP